MKDNMIYVLIASIVVIIILVIIINGIFNKKTEDTNINNKIEESEIFSRSEGGAEYEESQLDNIELKLTNLDEEIINNIEDFSMFIKKD